MRSSRGGRRAACVAPVVVLLLTLAAWGAAGPRLDSQVPSSKPGERGAVVGSPVGLQEAVSSALGRGQTRFSIHRSRRWMVARGGGVSTVFRPVGPNVVVADGRLSFAFVGVGHAAGAIASAAAAPPARPVAVRNRVLYRRGGGVTEWYENGRLGLEQGFTLREPPQAGSGPLTVALRVSGSLAPQHHGSSLSFAQTPGGTAVLRYGGVVATDADGRELPARLELNGEMLLLRVDDARARYPVRIDPLIQQGSKLVASGADSGTTQFGYSVALSGDGNTALVGGPRSVADPNGAAWVFVRSGSTWTQQGPRLNGSDEAGTCEFGLSVALSADGNTALVGGDKDSGSIGAAWVFTRSAGTWTQQGPKLVASGEVGTAFFGVSVALSASGDTVGWRQ